MQFTIDPASLTQVYDGSARVVSVATTPAGVPFTVTYNGTATPPVNAGSYTVQVAVNDPNYVGSATATLVVQPAPVQFTIAPGSLTQTFNGTPRTVSVSALPANAPFTVTYNGSTTPPVNAGTYPVVVSATGPNHVGSASATLVVQKATAQIAISALSQVYNAGPRPVSVSVNPVGTPFTVTYNGSSTVPVNAGSYAVVVTVNSPNYQGTASATLVVQKAPATASTGIRVINKGQALPTYTVTYTGFLAGQTSSVVTAVSFSYSPNYTGQAGVYQITVNATAANYTFTTVNSTLYVNPAGPGTKQVKPNFICYEVLSAPNGAGYTHIAYFNYENPNATPVYIPVGPNNAFSGSARDASQQPVLFLPGTSAPIAVPYMGGALTWQITSNKNNGTTGSIPANNSNVVCSAPGQRGMMDEAPEDAELRVYPNPSSGQVFLQLPDGGADAMAVEVYNALGALCPVRVERSSDTVVGIDLSTFGHGIYIIHIVRDGQVETRRVIIE